MPAMDYSKLRGRTVEMGYTQHDVAKYIALQPQHTAKNSMGSLNSPKMRFRVLYSFYKYFPVRSVHIFLLQKFRKLN